MSLNARTMLEQARSFVRHGDQRRALDLLHRARLLSAADVGLTREVLQELVAIGNAEEAAAWRKQLADLERTLASTAARPQIRDAVANPSRRSMQWTLISVAASVVLVVSVVTWVVVQVPRSASRPDSFAQPHSSAEQSGAVVAAPVQRSASAARPTAPGSAGERDERFRENVGMAVWYQRYEFYRSASEHFVIESTLSSGSVFAIAKSGIMLTNRHVVREDGPDDEELREMEPFTPVGKPTLVVCFGPDLADHVPAKVLHASEDFDFAILSVPREFKRPLSLRYEGVASTESVLAVGFPGAVSAMSRLYNTDYFRKRKLEVQRTKISHYHDDYTPDDFKPVATSGIISTSGRTLGAAEYYQFDAKVGHGNSGGPLLLRESTEVIGIVTLKAGGGQGPPELEGYNFALMLPQLREEIERYLK